MSACCEVWDFWNTDTQQLTFHSRGPWSSEDRRGFQFYALNEPLKGAVPVYDYFDHSLKKFSFHTGLPWANETINNIQFYAFAVQKRGTVPVYNFWNSKHEFFSFHCGDPWPDEVRHSIQFYAFENEEQFEEWKQTPDRVPKNLFVFWHGEPQLLVDRCIQSMRVQNPDWNVRVLDMAAACRLLNRGDPFQGKVRETPQQRSDWVRLAVLLQEGGCYLDASCICVQPLEAWIRMDYDALQGFTWNLDWKTMDCWALAVPPKNEFVSRWFDEVNRALLSGSNDVQANADSYVQNNRQATWFNEHMENRYFTTHIAWNVVSQDVVTHNGMLSVSSVTGLGLIKTPHQIDPARSPLGPYAYLLYANWNGEEACEALVRLLRPKPGYFIKLAGTERRIITTALQNNTFVAHGVLALALL